MGAFHKTLAFLHHCSLPRTDPGLFGDKIPFENNDTFSQFFKILRANEPDTSTEFDLDLSPIITYFRSFTSNDNMSPGELTQKLFQTFKDYIRSLACNKISVPHPTMSSLRYNPLIRQIKPPEFHVGAQRISGHIAAVMSRVDVPPGHRLPKARAACSTHAAKNGVSVDDIVAQGNWSSRR
ncbi:hypothetical protein BGZ97_008609, partial [Linnemannia gamsii]